MILVTNTSDQTRQRGQTHSLYLYSYYLLISPKRLALPSLLPYYMSSLCMYIFLELHITAQSGAVVLRVILAFFLSRGIKGSMIHLLRMYV